MKKITTSILLASVLAACAQEVKGFYGLTFGDKYNQKIENKMNYWGKYIYPRKKFRGFQQYFAILTPTTKRYCGMIMVKNFQDSSDAKTEHDFLVKFFMDKYRAVKLPTFAVDKQDSLTAGDLKIFVYSPIAIQEPYPVAVIVVSQKMIKEYENEEFLMKQKNTDDSML